MRLGGSSGGDGGSPFLHGLGRAGLCSESSSLSSYLADRVAHAQLRLASSEQPSLRPHLLRPTCLSGAVSDPGALLLCPVSTVTAHLFADYWPLMSSGHGL